MVFSHSGGFTFLNTENDKTRNVHYEQSAVNCLFICTLQGDFIYCVDDTLPVFNDPLPKNIHIPDVFFTSLTVNGTEYNNLFPGSEEINSIEIIRLDHKQNNLKVSFTALNYLDSKGNRYKYFLKSFDDDTIITSVDRRYAEYNTMKPGIYIFWVSGSNNDGIWNPIGRTLDIVITPPWYRSALAYSVYGLMIIGFVYIIIMQRTASLKRAKIKLENLVKERTSELEEKNRKIIEFDRVKTRLFTEISHEIRTPLSLIIDPIVNLIKESDYIGEERRLKWLKMVKRNGSRLMKLVNQLLDISRLDGGKMKITLVEADIISALRILANKYFSVAEKRKISYTIDIPDESFITLFDQDKIEKITSNLLSNAFKFTPAWGSISCSEKIMHG